MANLKTTYMGLNLKNPIVASASPLSKRLESAVRLEQAGIGAIVMYSLFEEQIIHESLELNHYLNSGTESFAESLSYLPEMGTYSIGPEAYLDQVRRLKENLSIPVIGSLNGLSKGGWVDYARRIEEAGADALELNIYNLPTNPDMSAGDIENSYLELMHAIRKQVRIPVAVKLSPFFTALPHFCRRLVEAGADGLVLFNRFYQPDFDLEQLEVVPHLVLSNSNEMRLPLRWIAMMYGRVRADFAITSGIHTAEDVVKSLMAGANVAMLASALLQNGANHVTNLLNNLIEWMEEHDYESVAQMRGSMSQLASGDPAAFERSNYIRVLNSFDGGERQASYTGYADRLIFPPLSAPDLSDEYYGG